MLTLRPFKPSDYALICEWTKAHDPLAMVPALSAFPMTTMVAEFLERPVAAVVSLLTNGDMVILEQLIADPELDPELRHFIVKEMIEDCYAAARAAGYRRVMGVTSVEKLVRRYEELGGTVIQSGVTILEKVL